jgi:hypothetical protein
MRALLIFLMPLFASAQQGWVSIAIQGDAYGGETTWLVRDSSDAIVAGSAPLQGEYPYVEAFLPLPLGNYTFTIYDSFGDGICCEFGEGWFSVNTCELDTTVYDFSTSEQTIPFEVLACPPPIFGCMQAGAINYHPWANAPATCDFPPVQCEEGYNNILVTVTPDTYASEISWDLVTVPDGEVVAEGSGYSIVGAPVVEAVCLPIGSEFRVDVYDTFGDGMCGSCYGGVDGNLLVSNLCGDVLYYVGDTTQYEIVSSDTITIDPCFPPIPQGCTDSWFTEYDPAAVIDDGSCQTEVILGCTDPGSINFNEDANTLETEDNCDFTLTLTDGAGDGWFGSWIGVQQGDEIWGPFTMYPADEFEKEIQIPLYSGEGVKVMFFTQGNAETTASQCGFYFDGPNGVFMEGGTNPWSDAIKKFPFKYEGVPVCGDFCVEGIVGCTLSFACNYNPEANVDSDCTFPIEYYGCDNECINDTDGDGVCDELEVVGCQDPSAYNYDPAATDPDDCEPIVFGCTDPTMFNYNEEANTENGSCIPVVYGCMDPEAFNYDEDANTELDDSCITAVLGCMDLDAANYNAEANIPANEDCLYDAGCITGPGNPYWLNNGCYAWIIEVDPYCCEVAWDATCVDLYEYCEQGWPQNITETTRNISVYPNPTSSVLNINAPTGSTTSVYDALGRAVISATIETVIDLSALPQGLYNVRIQYEQIIVNKQITKS